MSMSEGTKMYVTGHHIVELPSIETNHSEQNSSINQATGQHLHHQQQQQQQQQHEQQQQQQTSDDGTEIDIQNHQSASAAANGGRQNNTSANVSLETSGQLDASAGGKIPNSYKYPLLKRYFEFGPWIGRNRKALCLGCRLQTSSSQPDRLLKHLNRCNALSDEDKAVVHDLMNERTANKRKKPMQVKLRRDDNDQSYYDDDDHNDGSGDEMGSIPLSSSLLKKPRRDHMDRKSQIDEALTRFIVVCRIPLKAIHSKEFIDLVHALDPNYHLPSRETITNVLIPGLLNII